MYRFVNNYRCFRRAHCLLLIVIQDKEGICSWTDLNIIVSISAETSVTVYQSTRHHIPQYFTPHQHNCDPSPTKPQHCSVVLSLKIVANGRLYPHPMVTQIKQNFHPSRGVVLMTPTCIPLRRDAGKLRPRQVDRRTCRVVCKMSLGASSHASNITWDAKTSAQERLKSVMSVPCVSTYLTLSQYSTVL